MTHIPTLPHSPDAEEALLSCILNNPENVGMIAQDLHKEAFFHPIHQQIYGEMLVFAASGRPFDLVSFSQHLIDRQLLDRVGGPSEISRLYGATTTPEMVPYYKGILRDKWLARSGITTMMEAVSEGYNAENPGAWLMAAAEKLQSIGQSAMTKHRSMKDLVNSAIDRYQEASQLNGKLAGITTGFDILDSFTGGFRAGHLWVIGGGTSDGKSAYVEQMILAAAQAGAPCGLYTLEMSDDENMDRFFGQHSRICSEDFMRGTFSPNDFKTLHAAGKELKTMPIHIRDVSGISQVALLADMRLLSRLHGIKLFVIDYGQLVNPEGKEQNREREVAKLSSSLKALAKQTASTVIFVSQLNEDGKLRESRAIGFDADKAARIRVPELEDGRLDDKRRILHLDKNRGGERFKKIEYDFDGPTFSFLNERFLTEPTNQKNGSSKIPTPRRGTR